MFTGLIEEIGAVRSVSRRSGGARLIIGADKTLEGTAIGDSIAVNGVCQTVIAFDAASFTCEAMTETLAKTTFGSLKPGDRVHLERSLRASSRLGGHLVQGHVSGVAAVRETRSVRDAAYIALALPPSLARYCAVEGSIAIDGVSLTICAARDGVIEVNVIPATLRATCLGRKRRGDLVNVECDALAKYVERLLRPDATISSNHETTRDTLLTRMTEWGF